MDLRKIKKLIELLEESNIGELEIKEGEESVRISRMGVTPVAVTYAAPPVVAPVAAAPVAAAEAPAKVASMVGHVVRAPMVGTFYKSASPGSPVFVQKGKHVKWATQFALLKQ